MMVSPIEAFGPSKPGYVGKKSFTNRKTYGQLLHPIGEKNICNGLLVSKKAHLFDEAIEAEAGVGADDFGI